MSDINIPPLVEKWKITNLTNVDFGLPDVPGLNFAKSIPKMVNGESQWFDALDYTTSDLLSASDNFRNALIQNPPIVGTEGYKHTHEGLYDIVVEGGEIPDATNWHTHLGLFKGTSGSSGTSGISGTSGSSGDIGNSGISGSSGTSGTSGILSLIGDTANGVITYNEEGNGNVESNLTFNGNLLKVSGRRDSSLHHLQIGVNVNANNTASFEGLSDYYFDGNIETTNKLTIGTVDENNDSNNYEYLVLGDGGEVQKTSAMPKLIYVVGQNLTDDSAVPTSLSGDQWSVSKSIIKAIKIQTSSTDWDLVLWTSSIAVDVGMYDNGYINLAVSASGDQVILLDLPYIDNDASSSVHLQFIDNSGAEPATVDIYGVEART